MGRRSSRGSGGLAVRFASLTDTPTHPRSQVSAVAKIWIDGKFYEKEDAKISVFDHGLLYGDGVFEGIRAYNGRIFRLSQHIDRLYASARAIALQIWMTKAEMAAMCEDCIRVNALQDAYIRLVVTRGVGDLGLDPRKCARAGIICIADKIALFPAEVYERGLKAILRPIVDALVGPQLQMRFEICLHIPQFGVDLC